MIAVQLWYGIEARNIKLDGLAQHMKLKLIHLFHLILTFQRWAEMNLLATLVKCRLEMNYN